MCSNTILGLHTEKMKGKSLLFLGGKLSLKKYFSSKKSKGGMFYETNAEKKNCDYAFFVVCVA